MAAASQTKSQTDDFYLKKIHKNALLHQLLDAGGQAFGSRLQALQHKGATHSEVESVECAQCAERFTSRKRFAKHKQSRHLGLGLFSLLIEKHTQHNYILNIKSSW